MTPTIQIQIIPFYFIIVPIIDTISPVKYYNAAYISSPNVFRIMETHLFKVEWLINVPVSFLKGRETPN